MNSFDQKKLEEVGEKAELGKFQKASLERNRQLHMFPTTRPPSQITTKNISKPKKRTVTLADKKKRDLMVSDKDWGRWEKHTTGFGSKILQRMGYVPGKGLGKKGEGIVNPVKASKIKELGHTSEKMVSKQHAGTCDIRYINMYSDMEPP